MSATTLTNTRATPPGFARSGRGLLAPLTTLAGRRLALTLRTPRGDPATLAILATSACLAGPAAGVLPARRAARLDPLDALQYE